MYFQTPASSNTHALALVSKLYKLKHLEWGIIRPTQDTSDSEQSDEAKWISILADGVPQDDSVPYDQSQVKLQDVNEFTEGLTTYLPNTQINVFSTKPMYRQ